MSAANSSGCQFICLVCKHYASISNVKTRTNSLGASADALPRRATESSVENFAMVRLWVLVLAALASGVLCTYCVPQATRQASELVR